MIFLLRFWKPIAGLVLVIALIAAALGYRHSLIQSGIAIGEGRVQAKWDASTKQILADSAARELAAKQTNAKVLNDYNQELIAIAADRDSLFERVRLYQDRLRSLVATEATDKLGLDVASGIARSSQELAEAYDRYDKSCQRDAAKLTALQNEIRPQIAP